jgi:predicted GNAT superfamily acetyltransferase
MKICRNKKKHCLNDRIRRIEETHTRNERRKFYKDIKTFRQAEQAGMSLLVCKDDKGNILIEKQQVLE